MSCRAEVLCYQIVQSHVVFSYVISQSNVEHDDLYCSNIKHHHLYCLCVICYASFITFSHISLHSVHFIQSIQIQTIQGSIWTRVPTTELLGRKVSCRSWE